MKKKTVRWFVLMVCLGALLAALISQFFWQVPKQPTAIGSPKGIGKELPGKPQPGMATVRAALNENPAKNQHQSSLQFFENSLPQEGLPLSRTFDSLKRAADQGNYWASCRLAADDYECSTQSMLQAQLSLVRSILADEGISPDELGAARREIKILEKELPKSAALCEGYTATDIEPWKYLLQAALAGHVPSKASFVLRPPINISNMFSNVEFADAYKGNAAIFLLDAAAAGSGQAVEGAAWGYLGSNGVGVFQPGYGLKLLPTDYYRAAVYFFASSGSVVNEQSQLNRREDLRKRIEAVTTIEQRTRARGEADTMIASWGAKRLESQSQSGEQQKKKDGNYGQMCADSLVPK